MRAFWRSGRERDTQVRQLCQRLEFGLLAVSQSGTVEIMVSSAATMPRRNHRRRSRIVEEHWRRWGEPMPDACPSLVARLSLLHIYFSDRQRPQPIRLTLASPDLAY